MVQLKEATSKSDLKRFIKFPFSLYKDSPYWVPPLISDELETFDKSKNPNFKKAEAWFYLAYKDNKLVGRVMAIINWVEVKEQKVKKMRFGWFDFIDDPEVSLTLLNKVKSIGEENGLEFIEGPVGITNLDKVGVLIEGFETRGTMITWYNFPYYQKHYEAYGLKKEKEYLENRFPASNTKPEYFNKVQLLIKKRYNLREMNFSSTEEIMPWADQMFDLFNESYAKLASFVPLTKEQKLYFKKKYLRLINPEYIKFVIDSNDRVVAFAIVMPSFAKTLQKIKGRLFPFGFIQLLRAKKHSKDVIFYLIGVHPEYQKKGVTAIIMNQYHKVFQEKNIRNCYRTPELEENKDIRQLWKNFDPEIYKRRRTYKKFL
ncbi:GNAT family N-acetyltransferase [Eudoraea chungangensis]|uniref:GNAT family N-acetyltransferase n=1 Tax=Eudoraea chungangensis TaxID=1481905 RepID=UPI0023EC2C6F|nr:GNAT family N-acetyltransferase [Eudoraea chungangensis]